MFFSHYLRAGVDRTEVRFENRSTGYVLYDYQEGARRRVGVQVTTREGKEIDLPCATGVARASRLPELAGRLQCDADSALNGGSCP